jgi:hypothetical protein
MRSALCGALSIIASAAAYPTLADTLPPANKPSPKVGDVVEYDARLATVPCKRWEVKDTNKGGSVLLQCEDKVAYISTDTGLLTKITSGDGKTLVEFKPFAPGMSFPLELGKKWEDKYTGFTAGNGYNWVGDAHCEVRPPENVSVPAGQFEAYRVDCIDNWRLGGLTGQSHTSAWYAPKAGVTVKFSNAESPEWNYEVTGITSK